jgi:mycothione reductase
MNNKHYDLIVFGGGNAISTAIGGGYIACELGHFFHGVGVDTLLVVCRDQLLDREDNETRAVFMKGFSTRVPVTFNSTIGSATHDGSRFHIRIAHADGTQSERDSEALLFCIGRAPNSDNIGIENTDLKPNAHGYIETDDRLRTPVEGVYAMGDIAGRYRGAARKAAGMLPTSCRDITIASRS